jgi:hypothetical protein
MQGVDAKSNNGRRDKIGLIKKLLRTTINGLLRLLAQRKTAI